MQCSATDTVVRGRSDAGELSLRAWREPGRERRASMRRRRRRPVPAGRRGQPVSGRYSTAICIRRHVGRVSDHIGRSLARMSICSGRRNVAACAHRKRRRMHDIFAPQDTYPPPPKKITIADIRHLSVLFRLNTYGRRAFSVAGPMAWNSLPDFIRDPTNSTDCFRRLLKTYLFARY